MASRDDEIFFFVCGGCFVVHGVRLWLFVVLCVCGLRRCVGCFMVGVPSEIPSGVSWSASSAAPGVASRSALAQHSHTNTKRHIGSSQRQRKESTTKPS